MKIIYLLVLFAPEYCNLFFVIYLHSGWITKTSLLCSEIVLIHFANLQQTVFFLVGT